MRLAKATQVVRVMVLSELWSHACIGRRPDGEFVALGYRRAEPGLASRDGKLYAARVQFIDELDSYAALVAFVDAALSGAAKPGAEEAADDGTAD